MGVSEVSSWIEIVRKGMLVCSLSRVEHLGFSYSLVCHKFLNKFFLQFLLLLEQIFLDQINCLSSTLNKPQLQANCLRLGWALAQPQLVLLRNAVWPCSFLFILLWHGRILIWNNNKCKQLENVHKICNQPLPNSGPPLSYLLGLMPPEKPTIFKFSVLTLSAPFNPTNPDAWNSYKTLGGH